MKSYEAIKIKLDSLQTILDGMPLLNHANELATELKNFIDVENLALYIATDRSGVRHKKHSNLGDYIFPEEILTENLKNIPVNQFIAFEFTSLGIPCGYITISSKGPISESKIGFLNMLGTALALVIERDRHTEQVQHFSDRLSLLLDIQTFTASTKNPEELVKLLITKIRSRWNPLTIEIKIDAHSDGIKINTEVYDGPTIKGQVIESYQLKYNEAQLGNIELSWNSQPDSWVISREEILKAASIAIDASINRVKISRFTDGLQELISERTKALTVQISRAEEANRSKSIFLANMSHELRTPLTSIIGYSSAMQDGVFGDLSIEQKESLQAIEKAGAHLKILIDDILDLARIESGKESVETEDTLVNNIVVDVVKLLLPTAIKKSVQIPEPQFLSESLIASVDRKHIRQILINLLSNAIKYTPNGGKAWIDAHQEKSTIIIQVKDTGVGIPDTLKARLFERFERGRDDYSKQQEGTGIGLSIVKKLVDLNNGTLTVTSVEGKGSTFTITIPASKNLPAPEKILVQKDAIRLDNKMVIVIDDSHESCLVTKRILERAGAKVGVALSIKDGLEAIEMRKPSVVITDLSFPGELASTSIITKIREKNMVPILAISAASYEEVKEKSIREGADSFLAKPFQARELLETIQHLTSKEKS